MVLNVLLTHQTPEAFASVSQWWKPICSPDDLLVLHGGQSDDFAKIPHPTKLFLEDPRLRISDHQRNKQSQAEVYSKVADWLSTRSQYTHVFICEYDQLPLVSDLNARQLELAAREDADLLAHHVARIDDTSNPHFLNHSHDNAFNSFWPTLSVRRDPHAVLTMIGTGPFWSREAFLAVADHAQPVQCYLELWFPSLAHHLGFRVRNFPADQNRWIQALPTPPLSVDRARDEGAWCVHPIKCAPPAPPASPNAPSDSTIR